MVSVLPSSKNFSSKRPPANPPAAMANTLAEALAMATPSASRMSAEMALVTSTVSVIATSAILVTLPFQRNRVIGWLCNDYAFASSPAYRAARPTD